MSCRVIHYCEVCNGRVNQDYRGKVPTYCKVCVRVVQKIRNRKNHTRWKQKIKNDENYKPKRKSIVTVISKMRRKLRRETK